MLVTAQLANAPDHRCGCLALLSSPDLATWRTEEPYWQPSLVPDMECPDLFEWNGWWYLIYSTSGTGRVATHYRRSRSPNGPWEAPPVDTFDGQFLYAAKTAGDARRRFLFGWVPTRAGDTDDGHRQWGGHGTFREVVQDADGLLWVRCPAEVESLAQEPVPAAFQGRIGAWESADGRLRALPTDGFACAVADVPSSDFVLRARFRPDGPATRFGLVLRTTADLEGGYEVVVDAAGRRLSLRPFGGMRRAPGEELWRPLTGSPGDPVNLTVICSGSLIEVFVDDRTSLVGRFYDHRGTAIGLFVEGGGGVFEDVRINRFAGIG
jgi:beta-fructofuranosidase